MTGPLILRVVNFSILAFFLLRVMGRSMRQFFFAKHRRVRRQMIESVVALKAARTTLAESRETYERLPGEIAARRGAIAARAAKECEAVMEEARFKADQVVEGAGRLAMEERQRAERVVKERLLDGAFGLIDAKLAGMFGKERRQAMAKSGLDELEKACAGR
ncbi:MAG: hypothetical protein JXA24_02165 [Proteobacteria bacterium]|nr:hypothetical protein [Pseudomonadota bacterium]